MFTIDLLKGSGAPLKSQPGKFALGTVPFIVPAVIIIIAIAHYGYNSTVLATAKTRIDKMQSMIADYSDDIEYYKDMTGKLTATKQHLAEVSTVIDRHVQWSPIVRTLVEAMPDSIVLQKLRLHRDTVRKKMPDKKDKNKVVFVDCVKRKLRITVCGVSPFESDTAVQGYIYRLRNSDILMSEVTDIRIVTRDVTKLDGKDVPCFEIDCLFKAKSN
jgi:Tfp pilus assembly protein PilN